MGRHPEHVAHVTGDAVDIGQTDADGLALRHGAGYGLCQIYANEPWHYELVPKPSITIAPPMYADPTHDPRTHQWATTSGTDHARPAATPPP